LQQSAIVGALLTAMPGGTWSPKSNGIMVTGS
jgi:hypothetical protein